MNKTWSYLTLTLALFGTNTFAETVYKDALDWSGFYGGANGGYLWTSNNIVGHTGRPSYASPLFLPASRVTSIYLATLGTNHSVNPSNGFMGGGQIGYNSQFSERLVIGLDTDLDAINQTNSSMTYDHSVVVPQLGTYNAHISTTKKLKYLGLLKGRLGFLVTPSFLLYGAGGFAYGNAELSTHYSVTGTQPLFSPINEQINIDRILSGWTAGGGAEWYFSPCWSVKLEYLFYNLGPIHTQLTLNQNLAITPAITYAGAVVESVGRFTANTARMGVNYHFS